MQIGQLDWQFAIKDQVQFDVTDRHEDGYVVERDVLSSIISSPPNQTRTPEHEQLLSAAAPTFPKIKIEVDFFADTTNGIRVLNLPDIEAAFRRTYEPLADSDARTQPVRLSRKALAWSTRAFNSQAEWACLTLIVGTVEFQRTRPSFTGGAPMLTPATLTVHKPVNGQVRITMEENLLQPSFVAEVHRSADATTEITGIEISTTLVFDIQSGWMVSQESLNVTRVAGTSSGTLVTAELDSLINIQLPEIGRASCRERV